MWQTLWVSNHDHLAVAKTTRSIGVRSRICRWRMLHGFCRFKNIEDFRSQRNTAAEWSRNFLTVSKCKRSSTYESRELYSLLVLFSWSKYTNIRVNVVLALFTNPWLHLEFVNSDSTLPLILFTLLKNWIIGFIGFIGLGMMVCESHHTMLCKYC